MTVNNSSSFPCKIHLHIPNEVSGHIAPSYGSLHLLLEQFKGYSDLGRFIGERVFPECVRVASVDFVCIFNTRRYFDSVLVCGLSDPDVDPGKNNVMLL